MRTNKYLMAAAGLGLTLSMAGCGGTQATDMSGYNTSSTSPGSRSLDTSNVSSGTSFGAATLGAKFLPVLGKSNFAIGVNVSSFDGKPDLEFGKNPLDPKGEVVYNTKTVTAALQDIAGVGCKVVRIRLFNKLQGLKLDSNGLVTGLDDTFTKNLSDMLSKAEKNKVQVYVCLSGSWKGLSPAKDPVTDKDARAAYLKKAVTPLVAKLKGRDGVFGIDVFDEIESEVAGEDGNSTDKGATWDEAREFIKATGEVIKSVDPHRFVTASSGLHRWQNIKAGKFAGLGLDFYDFHVFDDAGTLPPVKDLKVDRPVLIGLCGQESKKADADLQAKADVALLTSAFKQGFAGALLTDYAKDADNPQSLLDKEGKHRPVVAQIQTFAGSLGTLSTAPSALGK